jgi:hypothetical protein
MSDTQAVHAQGVLTHDALSTTRTDILKWVFTQPNLSAWMSPRISDSKTNDRLALSGSPGDGKTSTAAFLGNHLTERGSVVCSHFYGQESGSDKDLSSETHKEIQLTKLSESILSQLLASRPELKSTMRASMKTWSSKPRVTPAFAAKAPLLHWLPDFIAESQEQIYIILEGLSETLDKTTYGHVLRFVEYITDLTDNVRVLVTSDSPVLTKTVDVEQDLFTNVQLPNSLAGDLAVVAALQSSGGSCRGHRQEMARL